MDFTRDARTLALAYIVLSGGELPALYRALGATLRRAFRGWRAALLVPDDDALIRELGLKDLKNLLVRNGGIRCRLLLTSPL